MFNGNTLTCNESQIDNCVKQCAVQYPPIDQQACVTAVEANMAPYSKCFSGDSTVRIRGAYKRVELAKLSVGDYVLDANMRFVKVIGWLHREPEVEADFLQLHHSRGTLSVTREHLVFCAVASDYVPSIQVKCMEVPDIDGSLASSEISRVTEIRSSGIYAPLTESGSLLVDGVHVSCYAEPERLPFKVTHSLGQLAMAPFKQKWLHTSLMDHYCKSLYQLLAI